MGFWASIKRWFAGSARAPIDYADFSDERLTEMWAERDEYTEAARAKLRAECIKRELELDDLPISPRITKDADDEADADEESDGDDEAATAPEPPPASHVIPRPKQHATGDCMKVLDTAVLLQTTPGRWALVLLPAWDPSALPVLDELPVDAIIVLDHELRGWLPTSAIAKRAGVSVDRIWSISDGAIDRMPGAATGAAQQFPDHLVFGNLALRRHREERNALRATWRGADLAAVIGASLPETIVDGSSWIVGSLPPPSLHWRALLEGVHAIALANVVAGIDKVAPHKSSTIAIIGGAVGVPLSWHTSALTGYGLHLSGREPPVGPDAVATLGAVLADRWDLIEHALPDPEFVADVAEALLVEARLADATRLVELALETAETTVVRTLRGTLHALAGELDAAAACYERVTPASAEATAALAQLVLARGDIARAHALATQAVAADPGEPLAVDALVRSLVHDKRFDEARVVLDTTQIRGRRLDALYTLLDNKPTAATLVFPLLRDRAMRAAQRAPKDVGEKYLARATELDPTGDPRQPEEPDPDSLAR